MKIFHKDIRDYAKIKPRKIADVDGIAIPDKTDFIQIPGSKNKIMKGPVLTDDGDIIRDTFENCCKAVFRLNEETGKTYRLPYLQEVVATFFKSGSNEFRRSFLSPIYKNPEWTSEVIINRKVFTRIFDETRLINNKLNLGTGTAISLAKEKGTFDKLNEFGYPETVLDMNRYDPDIEPEPVYWGYKLDELPDFAPMTYNCIGEDVADIGKLQWIEVANHAELYEEGRLNIRLVEVNL